uniref:Uncharacterized protein n=1 Tax=Echinococcus canadensis TaxID=519352 RepID=A0A915EXM4_9CEST
MQAQFLECVILEAFAVGIASYSIFQTKRNGTLFGRMQQNNIKNVNLIIKTFFSLNIAVNSFTSGRRDQALVEFTLFTLPQTYK